MVFDIKLVDGRYFANVIVCDDYGTVDEIESILENQYTRDDGTIEIEKMRIYKDEDYDGNNELAEVYSSDIEYVCKAYKGL